MKTPEAAQIVGCLLEDEDEGNADEIKREALASGEGVDLDKLDAFTYAYIEAMFFTNEEQLREESGNENIGKDEISGKLAYQIYDDCKRFQEANAADLADLPDAELIRAGHDFWFSRNGHGVGFWDGDWEEPLGERLDNSSKTFGQIEIYVGDDGKIYSS